MAQRFLCGVGWLTAAVLISLSICGQVLSDQFTITKPNLIPKATKIFKTFTTSDKQSWTAEARSRLTLEKFSFNPDAGLEDAVLLDVLLSEKEDKYRDKSYIWYQFRVKTPKIAGDPYVAEIIFFRVIVKDVDSLPLANYLFVLDEAGQKKEVAHIARQLLEAALH